MEKLDCVSREKLINSINNFSDEFFKCVAKNAKKNFIISALSAHNLVQMYLMDLKGDVVEELEELLKINNPCHLAYWEQLLKSLENLPDVILNISNTIFAESESTIKDSFKKVLKKRYNSDITLINFNDLRSVMSTWCKEKSNDVIVAEEPSTPANIIIINTIHFKSDWNNLQLKTQNEIKSHYTFENFKTTCADMHVRALCYHEELINADIIGIPFKNKNFVFLFIFPKDLNIESLQDHFNEFQVKSKDLNDKLHDIWIPKFKINSEIDLGHFISKMGLTKKECPLTKVRQVTSIEVNEYGAEGASYSGIKCCKGSESVTLAMDRPFIFKIVYTKFNLTLFSGRVAEPLNFT